MKPITFAEIQHWARSHGYRADLDAMLEKLYEEVSELRDASETNNRFNTLNEAADICIVLAAHFGEALEAEIAAKMYVNQNQRRWHVKPDGTLGRIKP